MSRRATRRATSAWGLSALPPSGPRKGGYEKGYGGKGYGWEPRGYGAWKGGW